MTNRTPLERVQTAKEKYDAEQEAIHSDLISDTENMFRAMSDLSLSPDQRLDIYKGLQMWPRIVLGLYDAELAIAQKDRKEKGAPEHGPEEPSEIAWRVVAEELGLSAERIRQLCKEGRRHIREEGVPRKPEIRAAEFMAMLSDERVAEVRRLSAKRAVNAPGAI